MVREVIIERALLKYVVAAKWWKQKVTKGYLDGNINVLWGIDRENQFVCSVVIGYSWISKGEDKPTYGANRIIHYVFAIASHAEIRYHELVRIIKEARSVPK